MRNASQSFIYKCCKVDRSITDGLNTDLHLDIGNLLLLVNVDKFCYEICWIQMRMWLSSNSQSQICLEIVSLPILSGKGFSLKLKGKVYVTCVRSCLMHGSETRRMKRARIIEANSHWNEYDQVDVWVKLNERKKSEELNELLGLQAVSLMIKRSRLRWFRHVERKDDNDWVKRCITWEVEGIRKRGRPKKTW